LRGPWWTFGTSLTGEHVVPIGLGGGNPRDVLRAVFTMDPSRFDSITKRLSRTLDRRTLSKSMLAAIGTVAFDLANAAAQTPCTHKLDCAEDEICSGTGNGRCAACDPGFAACPYILSEECSAPYNNRELCPLWVCVDLSSDPMNCGSCAHACAEGTCIAGQCGDTTSNAAATNASGSISLVLANSDGAASTYEVSIDWSPVLVNVTSGDAWSFFTAQLNEAGGSESYRDLSVRKLFAAQFDAGLGAWQPGTALYGDVAFGATSVVDATGRVHVVYTVRDSLDLSAMSTLVHLSLDEGGAWSLPQLVDLNPLAGHQLSTDLATDSTGGLHLTWQDQRSVSEALRNADPSNADILVSDLEPGGAWSAPVQISQRWSDSINASRPMLAADGDRLVAVWSEYDTAVGLDTAVVLMWSWRSLIDPSGWSIPQPIFDRGTDMIGGRFLDLAPLPPGGVALVYGRRVFGGDNQLFVQYLDADSDIWNQPILLVTGDRGSYPRIACAADGTLYLVYNLGSGIVVDVGAFSIGPEFSYIGQESNLTAGEDGIQGIASVSVDAGGRPWVVYFHQPLGDVVTEARVLANAVF
jgi:hypothetical protein